MKKIGITGASGHIGANLIRRLLQDEYHVRVLQHRDSKALEGLDLEIMHGGLEDPSSLSGFCEGLDTVIHLAAKISIRNNTFKSLHEINVEGTKKLALAAGKAGVRRFIHCSSIHARDHKPLDQVMDETRPLSLDSKMPYERTKAMAEEWMISQQNGIPEVIFIHPTAVVGPNDFKPSLVGQMIIRLSNGTLPGIVRGGYDWVDVRDICEAVLAAIDRGKAGESYFLAGSWKSLQEITLLLEEIKGKSSGIPLLPFWVACLGVPFLRVWALIRKTDPLYTYKSLLIIRQGNRQISSEKAKRELGFSPRSLADSLRDTYNWFKEQGKID